jgi:alkanesulfonate monooxygenase SsuD/methylene tetrahydromethanopterin reductase-like flavin-dependent oxidoreductase (luciferase family)
MDGVWTPMEAAGVSRSLSASVVGSPETVRHGLERFIARYRPDELMITAQIYDHAARRRSFEIVADLHADLRPA